MPSKIDTLADALMYLTEMDYFHSMYCTKPGCTLHLAMERTMDRLADIIGEELRKKPEPNWYCTLS